MPVDAMTDTVLFDFFGTLVDYSPSRISQGYPRSSAVLQRAGCQVADAEWLTVWDESAAAMDREADATGVEFSMFDLFRQFASRADLDATDRVLATGFIEKYLDEWSAAVRLVDGVPALLEHLGRAGHELVLVTNTHDAAMVHRHLATMGIAGHLGAVITSVEVGFRKPRREIFEAALAAARTTADRAVFVGDSYGPDVVGPTRAGIDAYLIVADDRDAPPALPRNRRLRSVLDLEAALIHR